MNTSGLIYVGTSGDEAALNCSAISDVYTTLDLNSGPNGAESAGAKAAYSALLSSKIAGKRLMIRISDGTSGCQIKYVLLKD